MSYHVMCHIRIEAIDTCVYLHVVGGSSFHVSLEQANKSFSKKPISQLEAIPELDILLSLSDNAVTVHELRSLKLLQDASQSLSAAKGANVFSVDVEVSPADMEVSLASLFANYLTLDQSAYHHLSGQNPCMTKDKMLCGIVDACELHVSKAYLQTRKSVGQTCILRFFFINSFVVTSTAG